MSKIASPALRALLTRLIDYAGMFPPAALTGDIAVENYLRYRDSEHAWMLRYFVVSAKELARVPSSLDGSLAILSDNDESRASILETKTIVQAKHPVYCETEIALLDQVKRSGCYGKIRTGGLQPSAIPSVEDVAKFIRACAQLKLPFKATAGLHHAIRSEQALTYEKDSPRAIMHGFLNVFVAASFAWHDKLEIVEPVLAETDPNAFTFSDRISWRDHFLEAVQVKDARENFAHAAGSCSFEEPVLELQELGLL